VRNRVDFSRFGVHEGQDNVLLADTRWKKIPQEDFELFDHTPKEKREESEKGPKGKKPRIGQEVKKKAPRQTALTRNSSSFLLHASCS